jgi:hypothetical protein
MPYVMYIFPPKCDFVIKLKNAQMYTATQEVHSGAFTILFQ